MNEAEQTNRGQTNFFLVLGIVSLTLFILLLFVAGGQQRVTAASVGAQSADAIWQDVNEATMRPAGEREIVPTAYRLISLDWTALNSLLANVPDVPEGATEAAAEIVLSLPLPDGSYGRFQIYQTAVMHPDLAAKFPEIQTYAGNGLDDPTAYARLDTTPKGFHAMILSGNGRV
ncbi:MAG: hypothetical protein GY805_17405, partial [Chloroflexi bacterium]|nr:hypothetical protein [Chloroflexota bacterium]